MVENVNIENVGGIRGVASEATLLNLVDAIRRSNANDPASANSAARKAQDLYVKSIKASTESQKDYTSAVSDAASKLKDFSEELLIGGDRLSDFADSMFGSTSVLSRFVGFVDNVIDNFRSLSSVGASFGNSMFEMISVSADAAMTLDGFVQMIRQNSDALARFGGNVSSGARFIAEFSRDVRLGIGRDFFAMGMTIEDINEGLIGFLDLETMRGRRNLRNDANLQNSADNYIRQLDLLTRLTGRQRSALMETQLALQTDAKLRNNINRVAARLGEEAANELRNIYTFQRETLPGFHDALMDLSDGVAQSDIGRALESVAPGITRFSQAVANGEISQEEYVRRMQTQFGPQLEQFASTLDGATIDVFRARGGFVGALAQLADGASEFSNIMNIDLEEARRDQRRQNRINQTLGQFEQGIIALRKFLFDRFIDSPFARKLGEFGEYLIDLFDENSSSGFGAASRTFDRFFNMLFGDNGYLTRALDWLADFVRSGRLGTALESMATAVGAVTDWFAQFIENIGTEGFFEAIAIEFRRIMNFLFGERSTLPGDETESPTGPRAGGAVAGILATVTQAFTDLFNSEDPNNPFNQIWNFFETRFNTWSAALFAEGENPGLLTQIWNYIETKFNEWSNTLFAEGDNPGLFSRAWNFIETKFNEWTEGLFAEGDEPGLFSRIWNFVETKFNEWSDTLFAAGENPGLLNRIWNFFTDKWNNFLDTVLGPDNPNSRTSVVDRIVNMLENALSRIFSGPAFQLMLMDIMGNAELMISRVLNRVIGMRGDFDERIAELEQQRENIAAAREIINNPESRPQDVMQAEEVLRMLGVPGFAEGTNGFRNFGRQGSLAVLHNTEAVVPRNTPAGDVLDAFYKAQENRNTRTTTSSTSFSQSDLGNKLDQLNNTMQQVVVLMNSSVGVQRRTMRNIHGLGTDLLRG